MVLADHVHCLKEILNEDCARQNPKVPPYLALTFSTLLSSQETGRIKLLTLPGFPRCDVFNLADPVGLSNSSHSTQGHAVAHPRIFWWFSLRAGRRDPKTTRRPAPRWAQERTLPGRMPRVN